MKKALKVVRIILSIILIILLSTPYGLYQYGMSKIDRDPKTFEIPTFNYKDDIYITNWIITGTSTSDMRMTPLSFFDAYRLRFACIKTFPESISIASFTAKNLIFQNRVQYDKYYRPFIFASMTVWVSQNLTIKQAMNVLFDSAYYGNGYYGLKNAAKGYFNKEVNDLNIYEALTLHILPFAPSHYSKNKEDHLIRLNEYIQKLKTLYPHKYGYLKLQDKLPY